MISIYLFFPENWEKDMAGFYWQEHIWGSKEAN